jgi:hypothetical protein
MTAEQYKYYVEKVKSIYKQIIPICKVFNINDYGYEVDENGGETLVLNGQKIGCTGNSVEAVVDELIAYIFITRYCRSRSLGAFEKQTKNCIMRYWK